MDSIVEIIVFVYYNGSIIPNIDENAIFMSNEQAYFMIPQW